MLMNRARTMAVAYIRHIASTQRFEIVFHYQNATLGIDRVFNFSRSVDETVNFTLNRIRTNVEKEFNKRLGGKKKKKQNADQVAAGDIEVDLLYLKNDSTTWSYLLAGFRDEQREGMMLKVCEQQFLVTYNYPYVNEFSLPTVMLVGFECYPPKFEVFFTERDNCMYEWYRGLPTKSKKDEDIVWSKCEGKSTFFYTVKPEDLSHKLKLICTPKCGSKVGSAIESISKSVVETGPVFNPFEAKHKLTAKPLVDDKQFRVVSYNLLADYYCDRNFSRNELNWTQNKISYSVWFESFLFHTTHTALSKLIQQLRPAAL